MKKILLAEDDFFIRDIYKRIFVNGGYEVDVAEDGEITLNKLKAQPYDLVLLDIMMPKVTGIDVLKTCKAFDSPIKNIPIFLITNLGQESIIKEAFRLGANGYFLKAQLTPQQILAEINAFFENKENPNAPIT